MGHGPIFVSRLQFAFHDAVPSVAVQTFDANYTVKVDLRDCRPSEPPRRGGSEMTSDEVRFGRGRKMASPFESGKAWRPRPQFKGRSPVAVALRCGAMLPLFALTGCEQLIVLDPTGVVAEGTTSLLIGSFIIMLPIVVPTILAALIFGWWYRSSNRRASFQPSFVESGKIELLTWSIPLLTIMLLGSVAWIGSHDLDPAKPLSSSEEPLDVQVVSLDWKWLFIYPHQNVASVNRLVIPAGVPVRFTLTSASVMNAFFVPQLGSMIYTMNGMATQLNLKANESGAFMGISAMFSGNGFADMHFKTEAVPKADFDAWAKETRNGGGPTLSSQVYKDLSVQSMKVAPFTYSSVEPGLFDKIVMQELPPGPGPSSRGGF
jgi:cytochrome o ubiquinol oxidase subunit 2